MTLPKEQTLRQMTQFDQWFLPEGEKHLQQWMLKVNQRVEGRLTYQYHKYEAGLGLCRDRRLAVDVGGHVGLLSYWMARDFDQVEAFEPVDHHRDCFKRNVLDHRKNVTLHGCALGEREGKVSIRTEPTSSGDSRVDGPGDIPLMRLDTFRLKNVDFLKIDCEGTELAVLRGAEELLARSKPVVMVEQKPGHAQRYGLGERDAVTYLESMGYRVAREMAGDFLMVHP